MIDPDLQRSINRRRCFALVGAGPSVELGYPSWERLAQGVRDHVLNAVPTADRPSYDQFLKRKEYPALFRQAEVDLGNRRDLLSVVGAILQPSGTPPRHPIYEYLARWPFACYLTTNFDDQLQKALALQGQHFEVRHNTINDLSLLRDGASHLIIKIHSDLDHEKDVILTSSDYDRILTAPMGEHIRHKLRQVFEMFDMFIIGHSMTDPDLRLILQTAKHTASPLRPIHMLLASATPGEIRQFREQYNIRLATYDDDDGSHRNLHRVITVADRFISTREPGNVIVTNVSEEEIEAASSLLLFQRLKAMGGTTAESASVDSILLFSLGSSSTPLSREDLLRRPTITGLTDSPQGVRSVEDGLSRLIVAGLVETRGDLLTVSKRGRTGVDEVAARRKLEEDQAYGQFELDLKGQLPEASDSDCTAARQALRDALLSAFRSRGIAMANVVMADQSLSAEELSDLFRELSTRATVLAGDPLRAAFLEAAHTFLIEPTGPQKNYLASVSQGFFLYHLAGLDPACTKARRNLFADTCWFVDSNVMIPLLAIGCYNHQYAVDFFEKLRAANATLFATEAIIKEVRQHLGWAIKFMRGHSIDSPDFLAVAMVKEGRKQNLFIDGYVRECAVGAMGTFADYLARVAPSGAIGTALSLACETYDVGVVRASEVDGFRQDDWGDIEEMKAKLAAHRKERGTFSGESQVRAEAEVLLLIRRLREGKYKLAPQMEASCRVYFVSQSRALDIASQQDRVVTWTPEAVYRYVSSLPGVQINADLLQECMLNEYFYAGIAFVDKTRYLQFFGPSIQQARISYREQIDGYLQQTEQIHRRIDYDAAFDSTPDLEKPFFVAQMGWNLARRAEEKAEVVAERAERDVSEATQRAREAEKRAQTAEAAERTERRARITAEQRVSRSRNLADPKHMRKRARQAKNRHRKKKR